MMSEPQEIIPIGKNALGVRVVEFLPYGYRLVQICCTTLQSSYELNYSFDKGYRFKNLRITVSPDEEIPSITAVYHNAFLYENEIHDLFGLPVKNIAIDYHGTLFRIAISKPFSIENVKVPEPPRPKLEEPKQDTEAVAEHTDGHEPQTA